MPPRFYKQISELLPIYDGEFSNILTAILINWEVSDFHAKQRHTLEKMRFQVLEEEGNT